MLLLAASALAWSCGGDEPQTDGRTAGDGTPIVFTASGGGVASRAEIADFPNGGRIGVTAALYDDVFVNWNSYKDIQDAPAYVSGVNGEQFEFTWQSTKYWPFDGQPLVFAAYSPPVSESDVLSLSNDKSTITITLGDDIPDVLYASNNGIAEQTPYSKDPKPVPVVDLGEFRYVLSRLKVVVQAGEYMNPAIRLDSLTVRTTSGVADLYLPGGDGGLDTSREVEHTYLLSASPVDFSGTAFSDSVMLFPGTEGRTFVEFKLGDGPIAVRRSYPVDLFEIGTPGSANYLTLERAHTTTAVITVQGTEIENPMDGVYLQGYLTPWVEGGNMLVPVN